MSDEPTVEIIEVEKIITATNACTVPEPIKAALVADLKPIADRLPLYRQQAETVVVNNQAEADDAAAICDRIAADMKAVKEHEVLAKITDGLHKLHRRWTGLRDTFIAPMDAARRQIKQRVIDWQLAEEDRAQAEQRRLQAEADEKARREREALEKKAAAAKKPETVEKYQEAAAAVAAPVVTVEAPKSGLRVTRVWKVKSLDVKAFVASLANRPDLVGFIEIKQAQIERAKAANPAMEIPGVVFHQVVR